MIALAKLENSNLSSIIENQELKKSKRGAFENKIFLIDVKK